MKIFASFLLLLFLGLGGMTRLSAQKSSGKRSMQISGFDSLDIKIGQMVMIGINDITTLDPNSILYTELHQGKIGGIVIFEKNIAKANSFNTLKKLIADLQKASALPLFISIDEEGGQVHRLKEKYGFVGMPSAEYLGSLDNSDSTLFYNRRLAAQISALGININYAPTVDVAINPDNPVIVKKGRSFSYDPDIVTRNALLCIQAHREYNVKTILKHFPGHGSSTSDSHLGITDVSGTWVFDELKPYNSIIKSGNCDAIMTAHIINTHLDTSALPATLSRKIVTGILREFLGFKGPVFSDDMQMHAISKNYGFENAIKLAINAGVDVLMFSNNVPPEETVSASYVHKIIKDLVLKGEVSTSRIDTSYRRIQLMKKTTRSRR
jgi:beta-N-acetylhexosaminidase